MKIVISPAKSLDFETKLPTTAYSDALFLNEAQVISSLLRDKKPEELAKLMKISDKLADLNWERNQNWSIPFTAENARPAVYTFNGDVYTGLDAYTLSEDNIQALQNSLLILSGLYGVLRPLDLIQAYRLEMGTKFPVGDAKNLHSYWKNIVTNYINNQLTEDEVFVNLASKEYFNAVDTKALKTVVVTPIFKDWKNDVLKVISFHAKKARGMMVRYIIDTNATTVEDLKGFNYGDYSFSQEHSNLEKNELVFVR